ncbi:hypothetical protein D187_001924 [Cystobacter fuscus DSM 2262]|uniref:Uncharacterized protein n=1 Tax=Cystobacter fuscus (strain ATCC 25194 / DSM 2262 / NBRC 100088 / M29) TaxID=1242864 RepID=S9PDP1_CYSF2|nr:hypothetical protein D187_001924 [Cystobacter fuscus DSM 2262]
MNVREVGLSADHARDCVQLDALLHQMYPSLLQAGVIARAL